MNTSHSSAEWQSYEPNGSQLTVKASAGDILIQGDASDKVLVDQSGDAVRVRPTENGLDVKAKSGSLRVRVPRGLDLNVKAASGDVQVRDTQGALRCKVLSGDVDCSGITGQAAILALSGDVRITCDNVDKLDVDAYSGDVRAETAVSPEGEITLKSKSGDIRLLVPPTQGLDIEAHLLSGDLDCALPHSITSQSTGFRVDEHYKVRVNGGGPTVTIDSLSGDIRIAASDSEFKPPQPQPRQTDKLSESPWDTPTEARQTFALESEFEPDIPEDDPGDSERMVILEAIENGEMEVSEAIERLRALD